MSPKYFPFTLTDFKEPASAFPQERWPQEFHQWRWPLPIQLQRQTTELSGPSSSPTNGHTQLLPTGQPSENTDFHTAVCFPCPFEASHKRATPIAPNQRSAATQRDLPQEISHRRTKLLLSVRGTRGRRQGDGSIATNHPSNPATLPRCRVFLPRHPHPHASDVPEEPTCPRWPLPGMSRQKPQCFGGWMARAQSSRLAPLQRALLQKGLSTLTWMTMIQKEPVPNGTGGRLLKLDPWVDDGLAWRMFSATRSGKRSRTHKHFRSSMVFARMLASGRGRQQRLEQRPNPFRTKDR